MLLWFIDCTEDRLTSYLPQYLKFSVLLQTPAECSAAFISNGILGKAVKRRMLPNQNKGNNFNMLHTNWGEWGAGEVSYINLTHT